MTRTRWAAHAWTLLTLTLTTLGTYTTLTTTWWWSIPTYITTSTTAALASGTYLKARREHAIADALRRLRARDACRPTGKDTPA